ncbi:PKD domain-containing protein [Streptomyces flaveolus]|uniref:PKD domain-containing protein n=1 Tax=Streptomyces flaveolus TaxID=67297 RepID=UPI0036A1F695
MIKQSAPKTLAFSSARTGGVAWEWDFGDGSKPSHEPDPTHTYADYGTYKAKLTVTYADGEKATATIDAEAGCPAPDARKTVELLDTDTGVANHRAGGGCTVNDLIDDEATWPNHGEFVSHVNAVLNDLRKEGVLDNRESSAIGKAAAKSEIGKVAGYKPVFDGTAASLADWRQAGAGKFSLLPDGTIRSSGGMGMLWYAERELGDFSVRLQFRDVAPDSGNANTGVFVRFPDPRTPLADRPAGSCGTVGSARTAPEWVAIYCGHEIQIYDGATGEPQKTGSVWVWTARG